MEDTQLTLSQYSRLLFGRALHRTTGAYLRDLGLGLFPAVITFALLYLGVIGKKIAVDEARSWAIVFIGISLWVLFAFVWNIAGAGFEIWREDQEALDAMESAITDVTEGKDKAIASLTASRDAEVAELNATVSDLKERMKPRLAVSLTPSGFQRTSSDGLWKYAVLRVHNQGIHQVNNCYAKLSQFWPIQTLPPISPSGLVPAYGTRVPWPDVPAGQACNIPGNSSEFLSLAVWASIQPPTPTSPSRWFLHIQRDPGNFPLPSGTWGIVIEVGADNVLPTTFNGRLTWLSPDSFLVEESQSPV